jgi:hypothetical protein
MIINDFSEKGKASLDTIVSAVILVLTITAGWGGYKLLNLSSVNSSFTLESTQLAQGAGSLLPTASQSRSVSTTTGAFVASKTGKAYYLPTCAASSRILEKNRVWFETREAAEKAGYTPAKNCPGL